jgi:exodeoxyribonuclease V beta subunit
MTNQSDIGHQPDVAQHCDVATEFDIADPLPVGLTLLEASAGTGKTFAIAALAARCVADGVAVDEILIITFTRAATGELRDRVRQRLVASLRSIERSLAGHSVGDDVVDRYLCDGAPDVLALRGRRLAVALAEFDRSTIVTTHAFCEDVLRGLGTAGEVARDVTFLDDPDDLLLEVVDDLYLRKFFRSGDPAFSRSEAIDIARSATHALGVRLEPVTAASDSTPDLRYRFATAVRTELVRRKQQANTLGYDDILTSLAQTLEAPGDASSAAARRLQQRYRVVLVDEFQDTDPVQWRILERGFARGGDATLVLVGDPKQAIYSFRGADVWTYLEAAQRADDRRTLTTNWRSDQGLLDAIAALFDDAALGHSQIRSAPAVAAPTNQVSRLVGAPSDVPMRVRVLRRNDHRLERGADRVPTVASVRKVIATDVAADIVALVSSGAELIERSRAEDHRRRLAPGDVAVLVATNRQAALIRAALEAAGVPAVINGGGNVFATTVATQWLQLLEALERPSWTTRARAASLTSFVGWDTTRLASATEPEIDELQAELHRWAAILDQQGVAALVEVITVDTELPRRVLARPDGERVLTDLRHIGELLHAESVRSHLGVAALTAWIRRRIAEGDRTDAAEERSRRLESDAAAVQVLTVHRSKGLEFPVVYLPDLTDHQSSFRSPPTYHDPDTGVRMLDVGGSGSPDHDRHRRRCEEEERGEDLRAAYVAMTRARHQVVLWWGPFKGLGFSPLGGLLCGDRDEHGVITPNKQVPADDVVVALLGDVASRAPGNVVIEPADHAPARFAGRQQLSDAVLSLEARDFDRALDTTWRRTSFTALSSPAHDVAPFEALARGFSSDAAVSSEPEDERQADEPAVDVPVPSGVFGSADVSPSPSLTSPMASLPRGAGFGVLVHAILEQVAFDSDRSGGELMVATTDALRFAPDGVDPATLSAALGGVLTTPLGPLVDGRRLCDISRADRLDELTFELPLAGGDRPAPDTTVEQVADLLGSWLPDDDPLASYGEQLRRLDRPGALRGYLVGSIDLLWRLRAPEVADRFVIIDYKTNWLGRSQLPLDVWAYRPSVLADAMCTADYPLQALLYSVAAHRYLRWRLPGYLPERHLGGVLYLFVRGMAGPSTPTEDGHPCGVFSWRPPAGLIVELSDLFEQGGAAEDADPEPGRPM